MCPDGGGSACRGEPGIGFDYEYSARTWLHGFTAGESTQVNTNQHKSTQVNTSQHKSTQVNTSQHKSTQVNTSEYK
jgi:hypothetical protein